MSITSPLLFAFQNKLTTTSKNPFHLITGFTLLEVIVALTIFATVGLAAFSWLNTSFISLNRISQSSVRTEMLINGLELLRHLNPSLEPDGDFETEDIILTWQSKEQLGPTIHKKGLYIVGVYDVTATMEQLETGSKIEFSFLQYGYKQQEK